MSKIARVLAILWTAGLGVVALAAFGVMLLASGAFATVATAIGAALLALVVAALAPVRHKLRLASILVVVFGVAIPIFWEVLP